MKWLKKIIDNIPKRCERGHWEKRKDFPKKDSNLCERCLLYLAIDKTNRQISNGEL